MAKPIIVTLGGVESRFDHEKLDRAKLYGKRQRQVLDPGGQRCEKAELTRDGTLLVRSGMTAQGYFDEGGAWIPNRDLVGLDRGGDLRVGEHVEDAHVGALQWSVPDAE